MSWTKRAFSAPFVAIARFAWLPVVRRFILDITQDIRSINDIALRAVRSGQIILGGGLIKHHICNANLMRNGADYSVFINTASSFDGSDAGAAPDEAVSWGKIRLNARPVKVHAEATLVWPLIVSQTFAKFGTRIAENTAELAAFRARSASVTPTAPEGSDSDRLHRTIAQLVRSPDDIAKPELDAGAAAGGGSAE